MAGQMNRASISVVFNISEGFLRRKNKETLQFLRYAFSSNGELKAGYYASEGRKYITGAELDDFIQLNESIARMLRRWQSTLDTDEQRERVNPETGSSTKDRRRTRGRSTSAPQEHGRTKDPGPRTD
jgi:four helix bundle protein